MGMPIVQELYGNLEKHELELRRYKKNVDDKKKWSLALKALTSFDDDDEGSDKCEDKKDEMVMLSKRL